jgi:fluoride exporter
LLGGGFGALTRYVFTTLISGEFGVDFPYGTLFVNVVGCFIMGFFMMLTTGRFTVSPNIRLLVTVGFLGGLTTFSSFGFETMQFLREGNLLSAFINMGTNLFVGLLAIWLGIIMARFV